MKCDAWDLKKGDGGATEPEVSSLFSKSKAIFHPLYFTQS
jgi:hypothetical protein